LSLQKLRKYFLKNPFPSPQEISRIAAFAVHVYLCARCNCSAFFSLTDSSSSADPFHSLFLTARQTKQIRTPAKGETGRKMKMWGGVGVGGNGCHLVQFPSFRGVKCSHRRADTDTYTRLFEREYLTVMA